MAIKAKGQITIVDQNDAVSFQAFINSNQPLTQIYTQDTDSYMPNWAMTPWLVLTPELYISGIPGNSISVAGRIKAGSIQWRRDGVLLTNGTDYVISASAPFSLTVKKNENVGGGNVKYQFTAIMVDPNNGLETTFSTVISFNTVKNVGSGLMAQILADQGTIFQNDQIQTLTLACDLYRGSELLASNVSYLWAIRDIGVFAPTTASAAAAINQKNVTLASVANIVSGSQIKFGSVTYTVDSVNTTTKVVTMTSNITTAIASGAAATCPHYDATLGVSWAKISADAYFNGITGFAGKTLTVPSAAVLNVEVFKCIAKDTSTSSSTANQTAQETITLNDMSDPMSIYFSMPDGDVIKSTMTSLRIIAEVIRGGEPTDIDPAGTQFTYNWRKMANGVLDGSFNKTGKTITIVPSDVSGTATFLITLNSL